MILAGTCVAVERSGVWAGRPTAPSAERIRLLGECDAAIRAKQLADATAIIGKLSQRFAADPQLLRRRGWIALESGRWREAEDDLRSADPEGNEFDIN